MIDHDNDFFRRQRSPGSKRRVGGFRSVLSSIFKPRRFKKKLSVSESNMMVDGDGDEWGGGNNGDDDDDEDDGDYDDGQ